MSVKQAARANFTSHRSHIDSEASQRWQRQTGTISWNVSTNVIQVERRNAEGETCTASSRRRWMASGWRQRQPARQAWHPSLIHVPDATFSGGTLNRSRSRCSGNSALRSLLCGRQHQCSRCQS
ncbi:uncharacterized protein V6R79_024826 [Siganus canaliculatus]